MRTVLLTGATGFVGRSTHDALCAAGWAVRCASRSPERAAAADLPGHERVWVHADLDRPDTLPAALAGCDAALYLVHGMGAHGAGDDYDEREVAWARAFAAAAADAGVGRLVYLGGLAPIGPPSRHLQSRLATGEALRAGPVPTVELRAAMIIGPGSASWRITRDLAVRLPVMLLPRWLDTRSPPIAIEDVVCALVAALDVPDEHAGAWDLAGPEVMSARETLLRVAALADIAPIAIRVPVLTPRLSAYWLRIVTRGDAELATELVLGLTSDLLPRPERDFWSLVPGHARTSFDDAARAALDAERSELGLASRFLEATIRLIARRAR